MESQDDVTNPIPPSPSCNLCGRLISQSTTPDDLEIFSLCGDCKFLLLQDFGTPPPLTRRQTARRRRMRMRRRRRGSSSESVSDLSTQQQFTHLISIARQSLGNETSSHTTPTGSTRWRVLSESESEDLDNLSNASFSLYRFSSLGDNDAVSFSAYGGEESESDDDVERSEIEFDTDIDPMHAGGPNQWNSDREWEEESNSSVTRFDSLDLERTFRQRILERRQALSRNIFTGLEDSRFPVADYLDERGFEELLEQLAESDNSRRGAPPASLYCVRNLPRVIIGEEGLDCAVCKEVFSLGNETLQLPCLHLYHAHCIVPWLSARNSCPLCRYELPTDDKDYEERKQNVVEDVREDSSDDDEGSEAGEEEDHNDVVRGESEAGVSRVSRGRWLFLAAAPVVSLVGVVLAMWLSNPQRRNIVLSNSQRGNRTRRWLPFF
ncbi:unnamed protein product [Eruca vesicaria subsp. sativa]|uniref:RING-type E3 ubiquitin transferase n=1 Tax=Eruca vesicaria subsp. sativa TaxID=29727 RepID=A0ABC8LR40_ERUVS|nr:unnamed protein product [Eruca vesicaria subsp. sativa]